jgi:GNAT superfamily N-acetyltransferase
MLASDDASIAIYESLPPDDVIELAGDAYLAGFSGPPYFETMEDRAAFVERVRRYATRVGFRLALAIIDDAPAGVGLAVIGRPGDWWRDQVVSRIEPAEAARWFGDGVLELVHLAVRPEDRGRGLGAALHDALLANASVPTAALSADPAPTPARHLYEKRGWVVLRDSMSIGVGPPVALLVRDLPALRNEAAPRT